MSANEIENIHDKFFRKVVSEIRNLVTFLTVALPDDARSQLDLSEIALDTNTYVSAEYKDARSDIVAKCKGQNGKLPADIYILFEHKSHPDRGVLLQLLNYMNLMWEKDLAEKKPLRLIIPLVFYHGKEAWQVPSQFVEQFPGSEGLRRFLPDFTYVLFDTNDWNWQDESNQILKENVFLLSAILLLKAAFHKDLELVRQVLRLWHQLGFMQETDRINFMLVYIIQTQELGHSQLKEMLDEAKLKGDEIMPTLAERWIEQGREQGIEQGMQKGALLGKQEVLIMQVTTRFHLTEKEIQLIRKTQEPDKLNAALKRVVTAQSKQEILESLNGMAS